MILTDEHGRPIPRPERADFTDSIDWLRAFWAYKDRVAQASNEGFNRAWRKALKSTATGAGQRVR